MNLQVIMDSPVVPNRDKGTTAPPYLTLYLRYVVYSGWPTMHVALSK